MAVILKLTVFAFLEFVLFLEISQQTSTEQVTITEESQCAEAEIDVGRNIICNNSTSAAICSSICVPTNDTSCPWGEDREVRFHTKVRTCQREADDFGPNFCLLFSDRCCEYCL